MLWEIQATYPLQMLNLLNILDMNTEFTIASPRTVWETQEGGDIYIYTHTADSLFYTAETNTPLQNNYTPIMIRTKIKKK